MNTKYEQFKQYKNYAIIGVISLVCLFFLPFTGSTIGLAFVFPNTVAGWVIFVFNKLLVAAVNIMILYCFVAQGKINIRNHPKYIEAREILLLTSLNTAVVPKSPREHYANVFGKKGVTLFITSLAATISLTQAILAFNLITFLTYLVTLVIGIIFGIIQMGEEEVYWTEDYWQYAKYIQNSEVTVTNDTLHNTTE